jgi:hypothetical protein
MQRGEQAMGTKGRRNVKKPKKEQKKPVTKEAVGK